MEAKDTTQEAVKAALLRDYGESVRLLKEILKGPRVVQTRRWLKDQPLMQRAAAEEPTIGRLLGQMPRGKKASRRKR